MGEATGIRHLLLLHGMGTTGEVWQPWAPLLERRWAGRWLAPDLAGHGWSPPLPAYSFEALAGRVVEGPGPVAERLGPRDRLVLLGHSLGGVVALALAARTRRLPVEGAEGEEEMPPEFLHFAGWHKAVGFYVPWLMLLVLSCKIRSWPWSASGRTAI